MVIVTVTWEGIAWYVLCVQTLLVFRDKDIISSEHRNGWNRQRWMNVSFLPLLSSQMLQSRIAGVMSCTP